MKPSVILVVDDELFFRQLYADMLSEDGCQVETVASGEEAINRLRQGGVEILLTDLVMPGMSGLEVLRQARLVDNPPEVILSTGHATLETAIQALKNGARDYLIKPFKPEELRHLVRTCLEQRRLLDENLLLKKQIRLFQRGQNLASLLEIDRLLPQTVATLLQEMGGGRGYAFLLNQGKMVRLLALEGVSEEEATELTPALLPCLKENSRIWQGSELPTVPQGPSDVRSVCLFPLRSQKSPKGGLVLLNPPDDDFPQPIPLHNLNFLAEQAGLGFENACLYQGARELIYIDDLTGLHNYRFLQMVLAREIRRTERYGMSFTLIFIDLDHFKNVNDTRGHLAGSAALKEVAGVLRKSVRDVDLLFRYGGDEFTALLVETDRQGGAVVAERIRRTVESHGFLTDFGGPINLTATVGYACFPEHASTQKDIVDLADRAMYCGKKVRNVIRGAWEIDEK
ncbi:MAG: diguanylate cyclase [Desulfuromonadales bacterium]